MHRPSIIWFTLGERLCVFAWDWNEIDFFYSYVSARESRKIPKKWNWNHFEEISFRSISLLLQHFFLHLIWVNRSFVDGLAIKDIKKAVHELYAGKLSCWGNEEKNQLK